MLQNISQPNTVLPPRLHKYGYNCIARHISLAVVVSAPLFIAAGTWRWDWAWIYAALTLIGWVASSLILAVVNPEILNERGKRATHLVGTKSWDWRNHGNLCCSARCGACGRWFGLPKWMESPHTRYG